MRLGQINTSFTVPTSFRSAVSTSGRANELATIVSAITERLVAIGRIVEGADFKAATAARREAFLASMVNVRASLDRLAAILPSAPVADGLMALQTAGRSLDTAHQAARTIASEGAARRRASSSSGSGAAATPPADTAAPAAGMSTAMKVALAAGAGIAAFGAIYYFTKDGDEALAGTRSPRALEGMGRCKNVMVRGNQRRMCWGPNGKLASNRAA